MSKPEAIVYLSVCKFHSHQTLRNQPSELRVGLMELELAKHNSRQ